MKDKKLFLIVITVMTATILLSIYMVYTQLIVGNDSKNEIPQETVTEEIDNGPSLTEIMDKINGYWHLESNKFWVVGFLKDDMTYTSFPYASEGGEGGKVIALEYLEDNIYNLKITLNPRLMCSEEFCEAGATIGQMSEPEDITIKLDISDIDNKIIVANDKKLLYLATKFDEIEKKIYN